MEFAIFDKPRPDFGATDAEAITADLYGVVGMATPLSGERDRSFRITGDTGSYVLKIGNEADRPDALEAQAGAMRHAGAADPTLPIPTVVLTTDGDVTGTLGEHRTQLTSYVEGAPPANSSPGLARSISRVAARLTVALRGYDHAGLHRVLPWDLTRLSEMGSLIEHVAPGRRQVLERSLEHHAEHVEPRLVALPRQAVHGDLNTDNFVVSPDDPEVVEGIFDFGDMTWGPRIAELAVASAYQCFGADAALVIPRMAVAFHVVDQLDPIEMDLLADVVAARCVQSLLMSARQVAVRPENAEYAGSDVDEMWELLSSLTPDARRGIAAEVRSKCGVRDGADTTTEEAIVRRSSVIAPSLELSYEEPVRLRNGEGVWLYEHDGRRLLDAYNNVPHVGHAHPTVVAALSAQTRALTTNTRYLVDSVTEYAERLTSLLPEALSTVMFVNSGSEANDLAYQVASAVTGRRGLITTDHAYHGTTFASAMMSPEEYQEGDGWAGRVAGAPRLRQGDASLRLDDDLGTASATLRESGQEPAMVIFDTIFSSEGIFALPDGYMTAARRWADANGALLVADEVQAGFGRTGPELWGFASDDAVPDIVTMGKPMGNGYPMGAVVTTASIADEFAARSHFFSTFAGSPMAAAAGNAVLEVMEDEDLAERASLVGQSIREGVSAMSSPGVVDVRGRGLFVGVELTSAEMALQIGDDMRRRGVLIGVTGPSRNVLKIRPPMIFTEHHVAILLETLRASLGLS